MWLHLLTHVLIPRCFLQINVYPFEHDKARAAVAATHTTAPKEGVPSRAERRKAMYTPRAQQRAQQAAAIAAVAVKVTP
jgi:hypothetical protein